MSVPADATFACPHCGKQTEHSRKAPRYFDTILMSRTACQHCGKEFLIVNNVPMTEEAYDQRGGNVRNQ